MSLTRPTKKQCLLFFALFIGSFFASNAQEVAPFSPRLNGGNIEIRGDIIFVGNNILNRASEADPAQANTPYNGSDNNNSLWMEYIDIDGDPSTFSSSSAELNIADPACSQVRYAGLYWAATYPNERSTNGGASFSGTPRIEDWFNIKFKSPGGPYVDLTADTAADTAGQEDDIIYDGYDYANINNSFKDSPYICYKNVTDLVRSNTNPNGSYTVANVRATKGKRNGSSSAGWVMVVIYENPNESGKFISTFDGYAGMSSAAGNVDVAVNGFRTLPNPFPVRARIGVGALEGDRGITNDRFYLRANSSTNFTNLSNNLNPNNNFFNSTITTNGAEVPTRNPYGTNTLGTDLDIFDLDNPFNSVLPNDENGATLRFTSTGDGYGSFLAAFAVEIIEPNIVLEKRVEDLAGNDITNSGVNLGQTLDYVLSFRNLGNDNAIDYIIRDVLPVNTSFLSFDVSGAPGVTATIDGTTNEVTFTIPDNLIEIGDPVYDIRLRVKVAENCFDFIDACSDQIKNLAYSTYRGDINSATITDDPSVSDFDNCGFITPGATNFLLDDLADCNFTRTVQLCGADVVLNAGDNFDDYVWKRDDNGNGQFDATDTTLNDGDPDNDPGTLIVTQEGTYIVDKIVADPCKGFKEIIVVERFGNNRTNPIIEYYNDVNSDADPSNDIQGEIVQCSVDGDLLPKIFLCGINDSKPIQLNILDAQSMSWERLDEGSCSAALGDCANKDLTCTWTPVAMGSDYTVTTPGKYRLIINYQNGCFNRYYFDVFQNTLDILYNKRDILCGGNGNITITNLGSNYGYRLANVLTSAIIVPFSAKAGPSFDISSNGSYRVDVVQLDSSGDPIDGACIFSTPDIGVLNRMFEIEANKVDASCTGFGSISLSALNAVGQYYYKVSQGGTVVDTFGPSNDNNYTFDDLNPGIYDYQVTTDDGCSDTGQIEIVDNSNLELEARVSQHITCKEGNILMSSDGGKTPHIYAIWSFVDSDGNTVTSYPAPTDIPPSEYQTSQIFDILDPGLYTFIVVDRNNCIAFSNPVEIEFRPAAEFDPTSVIDVLCFGESTGAIEFNLVNNNGYQLTYYLFDATSFDEDDYEYIDALAFNGTGNFPGLPGDDYAIVINQRKGSASCDYIEYHTISTPTNAVDADSALIQAYTCTQDAIIEAQNVAGGTAPYSYSIDGINFIPDTTPNAHRFENLNNGTYTITVRDAAGCTFRTDPIIIDPLNGPTDLAFASTQPLCPTSTSDGTVSVADGNPSFTYEIIAPAADAVNNGTNATFVDLSPGTYTFRVSDTKGCTLQESYTIAPITPITVNGQLDNNITCFGLSDGAGMFIVADFATSYDYSVSGPANFSGTAETANAIPLIGLAAGTYSITVTDTNTNCTGTADVTIAAPPSQLVISDLDVTDITCSTTGTNPGSVGITAAGGWGGYEYELEVPTGSSVGPQPANSFSGLTDTSGNYTVTVRDAGGCEVTRTFALSPAVAPVLEVNANSLCYDSTNGLTLTANVTSGGEAPFQYRLNGSAYQSETDFTGLGPGNYTIEVIDSKNCTATASISVLPTLTASANLIKDLDCTASPDAEISIDISGGNPTFTYQVYRDGTSFQANTAVPSVPFSYFTTTAGTYKFVITDSENCTVTTNEIRVTANTPPSVNEVVVDPLCATNSDGTAELQITGGTPPYQIVFDGSPASAQTSYAGLASGTYAYTVTDAKGCTLSGDVALTAPTALLPGTIDVLADYRCDNTSATLRAINYSGGTPAYTFSLDGVNFQASDTFSTDITAGNYTITIRDVNGCRERTPAIVIDPQDSPTDLSFAPTAPTCPAIISDVTVTVTDGNAPFVYEIVAPAGSALSNGNNDTFTGLAPGTYTFRVTDNKGCSVQKNYTVADIPRVDVLAQLTRNVTCFGDTDGEFVFTVSDFSTTYSYIVENSSAMVVQGQNNIGLTTPITVPNLAADTYTVTITDDTTNCTATTAVTIIEPAASLDFTFVDTPATCTENSTITVTPSGGWGSYQYQLENTVGPAIVYAYQGSNIFVNVPAGTYSIYVRDSGGCIITKPITIDPPETPVIAFDATSDVCYDGTNQASLVINITDGVAPYSYSINGGGLTIAVGNPFTISNLIPGTYDIQVTDAYGCVSNVISKTIEPQLTANAVLTQDLLCTGNAVIDVAINDGYTPYATYQVQVDGAGYGATTPITGNSFTYNGAASAGTYQFLIADARNCTFETNEIVVTPTVLPQATPIITDVSCFGSADGSVLIDVDENFGVAPYSISFDGSSFTTTRTYSGLAANTYPYIVRDSRGCEFNDTATVVEPLEIQSNMTARDVTCSNTPGGGNMLGGVDVAITQGGFANFTYTLYDSANNVVVLGSGDPNPAVSASTSHSFDGVDFGDYYVRIVDANGCESDLGSVRVLSNPFLTLTANTPPPDCPTGGTAEITASGGSGDYTFDIYGVGTTPDSEISTASDTEVATFEGLNPGQTYIIRAVDNINLCTSYQEVTIPSLSTISVVADSTTDISCTGSEDGVITFTVDNYDAGVNSVGWEILNALTNTPVIGTGIYSGTVGPGPAGGPQTSTVNQIPPGDYVLVVREASTPFCTATTTFRITEPTATSLSLISQTASNCFSDSEVSVRARGGTPPYSYAYVVAGDPAPGSFLEGPTFTLDPSVSLDWDIYVRDANLCISPMLGVSITVDVSPEITASLNNQCTGEEGTFSVDVALDVAGIAPYRISVDGGAPQGAPGWTGVGNVVTISNLSSGSHSFRILDANGCGEIENITLFPPLTVLANITADENCDPANSGAVTVWANGGSGTYSFSQISPAGATNATGVFGNLTHSVTYTFEVADTTTNCTAPVSITLPAPADPTFTLSATDVSCFGGNDGTIRVTLGSGNVDTPYLYSLDGGTTTQTPNVFNGLSQGTYNITVISDKGCENTIAIDIDEPSQLDVSASASTFRCDAPASTITVTINNDGLGNPSGTGPYVYSFDSGTNFQPTNTYDVPFGSPDITIVVRDDKGCTDTVVVPLPVRDEVTATITADAPMDCTDNEQVISINPAGGSGTYSYVELPSGNTVADPANIVLTQPGTYIYEITDTVTNCSVTVEHDVAPYDLIDVTADVTTDATCSDSSDGLIEVSLTGYTGTFNYQVLDNTGGFVAGATGSDNANTDPYTFNVATTLPAGTYSVQITETAFPQCVGTSNNVTINAPEPLMLELVDNDNATCNEANAIVTVQATGGTPAYSYGASVSGSGVPASFPFDTTVELDPTAGLNWDIYVQDANGCIISIPLAVTIAMDTIPGISLAIDDECADEGSFGIIVSLDAVNTGVAPYTMSLDGNAFESIASYPHTYTGLNAGAHSVEIRDANGCGETENIPIAPELTVSAVAIAQPSCATNDGVIEFTANGGSGAFKATLLRTDFSATGIAPIGNQFTGVPFGSYIVRITDTTLGTPNCTADAPLSLEEPTPVTLLTTDKTDVSCAGASDGTITVNLVTPSTGVNDNPPYTFEITDGTITTTQNNGLFTGLPQGTYNITVTSNRNCTVTDQVTIDEPTALAASITDVTEFSCNMNNAQQAAVIEVTITAGTGTPDYFYSVNGGSFLPTGGLVFTYDALNAGTYDFIIRDANGCEFTVPTQTIAPLNQFTPTVSLVSAISCSGPEQVSVAVTDDGNPHTYTFELLPIGNPDGTQMTSTATTADYNLSEVGSYTFRVTDTDTGCYVDTASYDIAPYDLIKVTATETAQATCFDDAGSLEIEISNYSGPYNYEVFHADGTTTGIAGSNNTSINPFAIPDPTSVLTGGNYFVRVLETSSPRCAEDSNVVTIVSPDMQLTAIVNPIASPTCTDDQGEILVDPSGGYAPYHIELRHATTGQTYSATNVQVKIFAGLSAGNYTVTIIDSAPAPGCTITDTAVLVAPDPIMANAIPLVTNLNCFGDTGGTVTAIVTSGGSGSYEYRLNYYDETNTSIEFTSGDQLSDTFTGLGEGFYSVTVVDGWNCDEETNRVRINAPSEVAPNLTETRAMTCTLDALLVLTASGGTAPYRYSTDNVTFTPMSGGDTHTFSITEGDEGKYRYFVIDAQGCEAGISNSVNVDAVPELVLTVDKSAAIINCAGENTAVIYADAEGGLGDYKYELYTDYDGATLDPADRVSGPQISGTFLNLTAGTYYVNVVSGDCTAPPQEVVVEQPDPLTYTDTVTDVTCQGENDGRIAVTLEGGSGSYQYAISPNLDKFDSENVFDELPGSPAGIVYTVIAQDQKGCFVELQYTIFEPESLLATAMTTPETCEGDVDGIIAVDITGGTAPFRTSLNNPDDFKQDRLIFTDVAPGTYFVFVRDANDCEYVVSTVVDSGVNLNAEVVPVYGCSGTIPNNYVNIVLEDENIGDDVVYGLDSTDPNDMQLNPFFRDMAPGQHYVSIASTASGCVKTYDFEIMAFEPLTLTLQQNNINEITAIAEGGREPYTFYFGDVDNGTDNTFMINRTDTYIVTVVDENGCEATANIFIEFIDIEIPNFFTPNGDNENDFWKPENIDGFPEILIKIYDRYGRVVAHVSQNHRGWDGRYNENELPTGDYWYIIKLNGENDDREFVGHFTLYR